MRSNGPGRPFAQRSELGRPRLGQRRANHSTGQSASAPCTGRADDLGLHGGNRHFQVRRGLAAPRYACAIPALTARATVNLVPPGLLPVRLIRDEAARRKLEDELHVSPIEVRINDPNQPNYMQFRWNLHNSTNFATAAPINVRLRTLQLRSGGECSRKIGEFACAKGERIHYEVTKERMAGRPGEKTDLVLTPSTAAAARHDLPDISGGHDHRYMTSHESSSGLND